VAIVNTGICQSTGVDSSPGSESHHRSLSTILFDTR
jgi:hypothetical protein